MFNKFIKKYKWIFVTEIEIECQCLPDHRKIIEQLRLVDFYDYIPTLVYSKSMRCAVVIRRKNNKLYAVESFPKMPKDFKPKIFFDKYRGEEYNCVKTLTEELLLYHNFLFEFYDVVSETMASGLMTMASISKNWSVLMFNKKIEGNGGNLLTVE